MKTQEIVVGNQTSINVTMVVDAIGIEEVVAIGYGTMKKSDLTGAVQHVNAAQFETKPTTNFIEMLNGTVAGFNSSAGTSASGGGSMEIRGQTSLKADNSPLVVVDGVIYNGFLGDINPADIESLDILKDASSSAIFGARSAAGVVIITTKRGTTEKPTINISSSVGLTGITHNMYPYDGQGYLRRKAAYLTRTNTKKPAGYYSAPNNLPEGMTQDQWRALDNDPASTVEEVWADRLSLQNIEKENYLAGKTTDWYDAIFRNGLRQNYDLSLAGGTKTFKYYWSLGYTKNQGISLGDDFKTIRSRINIDADVTAFLKLGVNAQFTDRDESNIETLVDPSGTNLNSWVEAPIRQSPYGQIFDDEGNVNMYAFNDGAIVNPLIYYYESSKLDRFQSMFASLFGELKLPLGFSYKVTFNNRYVWRKNYYYDPSSTPNGSKYGGIGTRMNASTFEWQVDNIFKWNKTINDIHKFDVTFLINAEKRQFWSGEMSNSQISPSEALTFHALQAGISPTVVNTDEYSTGNALMARLNYSLLERYLLTATWRRDGYSAFGQLNPYAEFPSMALGWKISEEDFFKVKWVNNLKFRLSWGANGNRAIGIYDALARLGSNQYSYGSILASGVYSATMANENLKWEKTEALNVGVDFGLFNNRINGSAEVYSMTTKDLLLNRSLPSIIGYSSVAANLGELENKGLEVTLNSVNINKPGIKWNSGLLFSMNRNEIKHLYGDMVNVTDADGNIIGQKETDDIANGWFIGQALDRIYDYKVLGVWQEDESTEAAKYGKIPGDMKLWDVNGDGKLVPIDDKVFQGYKNPRYHLGLRNDLRILKNIEISAFIKADLDFYGANDLYINDNNVFFERWNGYALPYWTPENPSNEWAAPASNNKPSFNVYKSRSYARLQDVSVSYLFPQSILSKTKIQDMKIYVNFTNLLTLTGWENWDPESGARPMPKFSTIGINLTL